jgi:hypothetical protein
MIDSTVVMYEAFQSCRHRGRDAQSDLRILAAVLDAVHRQNTLLVHVTFDIPASWTGLGQSRLPAADADAPHGGVLTPAHTELLAVVDEGARELERLVKSGQSEAVRNLGYALHVLPAILWAPGDFSPSLYAFNFGVAAKTWDVLSDSMRDALSALVGHDLAQSVLREIRSEADQA